MSVELIGREDIYNELILCERSAKNHDKKICFIPSFMAFEYMAIMKLEQGPYLERLTKLANIEAASEEEANIKMFLKFKECILKDIKPGYFVTMPDFVSRKSNANKRSFYTYADFTRICSPLATIHEPNSFVFDTTNKMLIKIPTFNEAFPDWILKNRKECAIEGPALRKYLESIGFKFYCGAFPSKVYYNYFTIRSMPEAYYEYSEYDLLHMDWSEFDKKILPLVEHEYEHNFCAVIENNKIRITYIELGQLGYTLPNYYEPINGHTHTAGRSGDHHTEEPSPADLNTFGNAFIHKAIAMHFICTRQGVYILSMSKSIIKNGNLLPKIEHIANTINCKTNEEAVSRVKHYCASVGIIVMYRPIANLSRPIDNVNKKRYSIAEYAKISNSGIELTPKMLLAADLSELRKFMPEPEYYNFTGAYFDNKKIKIDQTFSTHSFNEPFNSRRHRDIDISNKIVVAIMNDGDFPQLLSFKALKSVFASDSVEWLYIVSPTTFKLISRDPVKNTDFIDYSTPPTIL